MAGKKKGSFAVARVLGNGDLRVIAQGLASTAEGKTWLKKNGSAIVEGETYITLHATEQHTCAVVTKVDLTEVDVKLPEGQGEPQAPEDALSSTSEPEVTTQPPEEPKQPETQIESPPPFPSSSPGPDMSDGPPPMPPPASAPIQAEGQSDPAPEIPML